MLLLSPAFAQLPAWVTHSNLSDTSYHYVVCSHDGADPEEVRQIAENRCLASAAKLGGVKVTLSNKTVQSLTGADSSEVAEIVPFEKNVKCEWTDRYQEKIENGFRIWLRCRILKSEIEKRVGQEDSPGDKSANSKVTPYKRALLTITSVPQADKIVIEGHGPSRVIDPKSNLIKIEVTELDTKVVVRKQKFKDGIYVLPNGWKHGDSLFQTIYLQQDL